MNKRHAALRIAALALLIAATANAGIVDTKHNMSASGPGPVKTFGEDEVCIFCHTPHNASPVAPLWNRELSALTYQVYASSTLAAIPGQPTGSSKLCLSCHDGTIALGNVITGPPIQFNQTVTGRANLTSDLSDDHPVSFLYDSALLAGNSELVDPAAFTNSAVTLDDSGQMQCTACHDPHTSDQSMFLVMDPAFSALCVSCHNQRDWPASSHNTSSVAWSGMGIDPWPYSEGATVAANGCQGCHTSHAAGFHERLLTFDTEEGSCLACHNGNVARLNIEAELAKASTHPVASTLRVHDPSEDFATMARHVECQDCHDPHASTDSPATAPLVSGALASVRGVTSSGTPVDNAQFEYEVCLRCHANDATTTIPRVLFQPNLRQKIDVANASFHPIVSVGTNPDVPSLISPLNESSQLYCSDCHNNDQGPGANGSGPAGPHGSNWPLLLEREYTMADGFAESYQRYAMCYKCHSRSSILGDQSFKGHREHIVGENVSCATCHDPHGVVAGGMMDTTHLINFNADEVVANSDGDLLFEDLGTFTGSCSLTCHGEDHRSETYK